MKKISAVLLVLVLVGSVAFAGFTGYARTGIGYDFDTSDYGFLRKTTSASIDVTLNEFIGEAKTEGDIYVDIKATLKFTFDNADASGIDNDTTTPGTQDDPTLIDIDLTFNHAKIVGDGWYVGILNAVRPANFATSAIDTSDYTPADNDLGFGYDDVSYAADIAARYHGVDRNAGLEVGYQGYVLGLGLNGNADAETYNMYGTVTTPAYELGDGLTAQFGVSGKLTKTTLVDDKAAAGSVKVAYASDDLSVSVASDVVYNNDLMADVAFKAAYDIVTLDAYYATDEVYVNTDDAVADPTGKKNLLSAKVAVDLDPMTVTVTAKDIVDTKDLSASVKYQVSDELAVTARGGYNVGSEVIKGGADVEYKTADYTAKAGGTYYTKGATAYTKARIQLNASVESTTIIPGATLKLAYAGDDLTDAKAASSYDNGDKGKVYAEIKIAF
ncbi:MAG: hypothetical protein CVV46_02400 [Spirochaetae bacterium HGW-Spirochaetae-2]|jgi:hypothetical protein|nr:MAG: hypothetical protein CVV46_02400 [Spirochaetae bacterium HGW-Spirochaetae-2]